MTNNYIQSIKLDNFQSHKKTEIEPAPPGQLTVIIGPSDSGKTALIRGLKWLSFNSPQGADFIRVGTQQATATAIMGQGQKITRTKSRGGVNRYILEDLQHPAPRVFESFGIGVPLEVQHAIEMTPISIGDMEFNLNLSEQLDGPFLGNNTPSTARAKMLGKLSGVEEVDHAGKTLSTDLYRKRREVEGIRSQIEYLGKKIEEYGYLDELGPMTEIVDKAVTDLKAKVEKKQALLTLKIKLAGTVAAIRQEEEKLKELSDLALIEGVLIALVDNVDLHKKLNIAYGDMSLLMDQLQQTQNIIKQTQEIPTAEDVLSLAVTKSSRLIALLKLSEDTNTITRDLNQTEIILEATKDIPAALDLAQYLPGKSETLKALNMKWKDMEFLKAQEKNAEIVLNETQKADDLLIKIQALTKVVEQKTLLTNKQSLLRQNQQAITTAETELATAATNVTKLTNELDSIRKEIVVVCPQCGYQLDNEKLLKEAV